MDILVIGRSGQLASELARKALPAGDTLACFGRETADLATPGIVQQLIRDRRPDLVINAAGYTAVDKAEGEYDQALLLNATGPAAAAAAAAEIGAGFVQVSTDYVFDGTKAGPYVEDDPIAPVNAYGRSKAEGEAAVLAANPLAAVVRTSWVYSPYGANFVRTMLRLAESREEVAVVADQIGRPTAATDLADACLTLGGQLKAPHGARGLFHYAGAGDATWADFAQAIFERSAQLGGPQARVRRIRTADFPTPAKRPSNSRLDTGKIEGLGIAPPDWRAALSDCVASLSRGWTPVNR